MNGKVLERYAELMIDKIRQMSAGEWQKPWFTPRTGLPQNISGRPYNSMNRLMLYMEMDRMGYTLPVFMTFRQLKDENLMVIKGSHALPVTFYDITVKHIDVVVSQHDDEFRRMFHIGPRLSLEIIIDVQSRYLHYTLENAVWQGKKAKETVKIRQK